MITQLKYIIIIIFVILGDQISKHIMSNMLQGKIITINNFISLAPVYNTGISFGMLSQLEYSNIVLLTINFAITIAMLIWLIKDDDTLHKLSLAFIAGGAMGNLIDRINIGAVYDFIDIHVSGYHWPTFNLADASISLGAALFLWASFRKNQDVINNRKGGKI